MTSLVYQPNVKILMPLLWRQKCDWTVLI